MQVLCLSYLEQVQTTHTGDASSPVWSPIIVPTAIVGENIEAPKPKHRGPKTETHTFGFGRPISAPRTRQCNFHCSAHPKARSALHGTHAGGFQDRVSLVVGHPDVGRCYMGTRGPG